MRCKGCIAVCVGLIIIGIIVPGMLTMMAGRFLAVDDGISTSDAIVSLGGDYSEGFSRVRHSVDLFNDGYAPVVVLSGGTMAGAGLACSSAALSLEAAQELGLPPKAIIIAGEAQTTYDEAQNLADLVREQGWDSIIIVTDIFHTRRAAWTFRTFLPETTIYVSAAPDPRYDPARWWDNEYSLLAVINETIKLFFYWFKYGISPL